MLKKTAYVSLGGIGGIYIKDISVKAIEFGTDGMCGIKDMQGNIIVTHLSNVVYLESDDESEVEDNA